VLLLIALAAGLALFARILDDSFAHSQPALQSDALVQGIAEAFQLNALLLVLFGATTMCLAHLVAAQGRGRELGILRAMGLPARRWPILLVVEASLVLILGLLAGAVVGLGLSHTMIPYLSSALVEPLAGVAIEQIVVDWPAVVRLYVGLLALYGSALALLRWVLGRGHAHRAPWLEDE
jgi:predicted lysophospholipase L1 biosynthesis ABC-type transport system permease subunit